MAKGKKREKTQYASKRLSRKFKVRRFVILYENCNCAYDYSIS